MLSFHLADWWWFRPSYIGFHTAIFIIFIQAFISLFDNTNIEYAAISQIIDITPIRLLRHYIIDDISLLILLLRHYYYWFQDITWLLYFDCYFCHAISWATSFMVAAFWHFRAIDAVHFHWYWLTISPPPLTPTFRIIILRHYYYISSIFSAPLLATLLIRFHIHFHTIVIL